VYSNWKHYKENLQLLVLGSAIIILSYIGYHIKHAKNNFIRSYY